MFLPHAISVVVQFTRTDTPILSTDGGNWQRPISTGKEGCSLILVLGARHIVVASDCVSATSDCDLDLRGVKRWFCLKALSCSTPRLQAFSRRSIGLL